MGGVAGVFAAAGIGLIVLSRLPARTGPPSPAERVADVSETRSLRHFTAQLEPLSERDGSLVSAFRRRIAALAEPSAAEVQGRVTRVLASGHEIETELHAKASRTGESFSTTVLLDRGPGRRTSYEARGERGEMTSLVVRDEHPEGPAPPIHVDLRTFAEGRGPAVTIGDLRLRDSLVLLQSARDESWEPLGILQGLGSRRLAVFSTRARDDDRARALIYVDAATLDVRSIRVFDAKERLVSEYGDFVVEDAFRGVRRASFSVRSWETSSTSTFRFTHVRVR